MVERPAVDRQRPDVVVLDVRVSTEFAPGGRPRRRGVRSAAIGGRPRRRGVRSAAIGSLLGLAVTGLLALAIAWRPGPAPARTARPPASARLPGAAGVAAAYGEPARCLVVTIAPAFPGYARADFNRARACGRYTGDPTAIFVRTAGAWRTVIDAATYTCPVAGMPAGAQRALEVCAAPAPPAAARTAVTKASVASRGRNGRRQAEQ